MKSLKTDEEWMAWGAHDPMYGVATWDGRSKSGDNPWTEREFFELGRQDWHDFYSVWNRLLPVNTDSILEIGCGAGRITKQLVATFDQVYAIDVSKDMIAFAKKNITEGNVVFTEVSGTNVPLENVKVSAVFSCHVFQHLESIASVEEYFKEVYRVLKPGGNVLIHIPIHQFPISNKRFSGLIRHEYNLFLKITNIKADLYRKRMRHGGRPCMHGISIEQPCILEFLGNIGFEKVAIVTIRVSSNNGIHNCIVAQKPESNRN